MLELNPIFPYTFLTTYSSKELEGVMWKQARISVLFLGLLLILQIHLASALRGNNYLECYKCYSAPDSLNKDCEVNPSVTTGPDTPTPVKPGKTRMCETTYVSESTYYEFRRSGSNDIERPEIIDGVKDKGTFCYEEYVKVSGKERGGRGKKKYCYCDKPKCNGLSMSEIKAYQVSSGSRLLPPLLSLLIVLQLVSGLYSSF